MKRDRSCSKNCTLGYPPHLQGGEGFPTLKTASQTCSRLHQKLHLNLQTSSEALNAVISVMQKVISVFVSSNQ